MFMHSRSAKVLRAYRNFFDGGFGGFRFWEGKTRRQGKNA